MKYLGHDQRGVYRLIEGEQSPSYYDKGTVQVQEGHGGKVARGKDEAECEERSRQISKLSEEGIESVIELLKEGKLLLDSYTYVIPFETTKEYELNLFRQRVRRGYSGGRFGHCVPMPIGSILYK